MVASVKGHLDQEQQGKQSTAQQLHIIPTEPESSNEEQLDKKRWQYMRLLLKWNRHPEEHTAI